MRSATDNLLARRAVMVLAGLTGLVGTRARPRDGTPSAAAVSGTRSCGDVALPSSRLRLLLRSELSRGASRSGLPRDRNRRDDGTGLAFLMCGPLR